MIKALPSILLLVCACTSSSDQQPAEDSSSSSTAFDKVQWSEKKGHSYPYRDNMLDELIQGKRLKPLKKEEVFDLLGQPDRVDSNYLFYLIKQRRLGSWPLHTKTLVIKLSQDTSENTILIHE